MLRHFRGGVLLGDLGAKLDAFPQHVVHGRLAPLGGGLWPWGPRHSGDGLLRRCSH